MGVEIPVKVKDLGNWFIMLLMSLRLGFELGGMYMEHIVTGWAFWTLIAMTSNLGGKVN